MKTYVTLGVGLCDKLVRLCLPTPLTLVCGGGEYFDHPGFGPPASISLHLASRVCPQIQGRQCGAYVGAVEEMMCVVCVDVTEGA